MSLEPPAYAYRPPRAVSAMAYYIAATNPAFLQGEGIICNVSVFRSFTDARQFSAKQRSGPYTYRILHIAHPAAPGEWLSVGGRYANLQIEVVVVYRNLDFELDSTLGTATMSVRQQERAFQAGGLVLLDAVAKLLDRAKAYAAHPINSIPLPAPPLTPAQRARNKAMTLLLNYWSSYLGPCENDMTAVATELRLHSYASLDALAIDTDTTVNDCTTAADIIENPLAHYNDADRPPAYLLAPLSETANEAGFKAIFNAISKELFDGSFYFGDVQRDVEDYRNYQSDLPASVLQDLAKGGSAIMGEIAATHKAIAHIEHTWRMA